MSNRSRFRKALYGVASVMLALLALEGASRLGLIAAVRYSVGDAGVREYLSNMRLVYDPVLGWRPATVLTASATSFDNVHAPLTPPPGRLRGIALGDSQTQGATLVPAKAWPGVAERVLRERGWDIEILNAGNPGWRSAQALKFVETVGLAYSPDFLVVDCMAKDGTHTPRNYAATPNPMAPVLFESRLYRVLWLGVAAWRGDHPGAVGRTDVTQPVGAAQHGPGNHAELMALAENAGIQIVFVDYPVNSMASIVARASADMLPPGAIVVPATPALLATGRPSSGLFFDLNHMTAEGSEVTGIAVANVLERVLER